MSDTQFDIEQDSSSIAGRWQIPAFAISAFLLAGVALQVESPTRKAGLETNLTGIVRFIDSGLYDTAAETAHRVLAWEDLDDHTRGTLHLYLARAAFGKAERIEDESEATAAAIIESYETALTYEQPLIDADHHKLAVCYENLGQYQLAVKQHALAAETAPAPALDHRRRVIELSRYPLQIQPEKLDKLLTAFMADASEAPADLLWALDRKVEILSAAGRWEEADALLGEYAARFEGSPWDAEYGYLLAYAEWGAGRYDAAERRLRELLNRVTVSDPVHPKAGWLLGKVVMYDGTAQRPEEALAILRDVVSAKANQAYVTAARIAMAEAQAELFRFEDARASFRQAIAELHRVGDHHLVNPEAIRSALSVVAEQAFDRDRRDVAIDFLDMAAGLIDPNDHETLSTLLTRLADMQAVYARELRAADQKDADGLDDAAIQDRNIEADRLLNDAGENYVRVAWMSTLNERRSAAAMWTAAGLFDEAGNHQRAIELLQAFDRDRPDAEIIPRVLLRLGRSQQAEGQYRAAIDAYQRNLALHPRSPHANAALIPLAQCFMAIGDDGETEAENALLGIVEDSDLFTPAAPEYREAMFLLGTLYNRQQRYEEAIPVLDEALLNYPDDPQIPQAMLQIADAYFRSALAIKEEMRDPKLVGESKRLRAELATRLAVAAERFHSLVEMLAAREDDLETMERLYLQDARLYEAACRFEQERYTEALALYERAAWIYKDSPAALGAYVQVINCYIFLGREEEAEASLRRAQYLVETIDEALFERQGQFESRAGWRRYFDWVADILMRQ